MEKFQGDTFEKSIENGELTNEEIEKCEKNEKLDLQIKHSEIPRQKQKVQNIHLCQKEPINLTVSLVDKTLPKLARF